MSIVLLTAAIVIVVGIIMLVVRSVVFKLISMTLLALALILVVSLVGDKMSGIVTPLALGDTMMVIHQDGEDYEINYKDVQSVYVVKGEDGVSVSVTISGKQFTVKVNSLAYEWTLKNTLNRLFEGRITFRGFG